jgi:hypothetical protein
MPKHGKKYLAASAKVNQDPLSVDEAVAPPKRLRTPILIHGRCTCALGVDRHAD